MGFFDFLKAHENDIKELSLRVALRQIQIGKVTDPDVKDELMNDNEASLRNIFVREGKNWEKAKSAFLKSKGMTEASLPPLP